ASGSKRTGLWRGMVFPFNRSTLLVVAKEASDPEGRPVTLRWFATPAEICDFAFSKRRTFERLMLWRSPATEDGAPFVRAPDEPLDTAAARLAAELTVPLHEKHEPPARRASRFKELGPLWVLMAVSAALLAMTFLMHPSPPPKAEARADPE